ncbi:hypothetical protein D3C86_1506450 [compost metagenome]
MASYQAAVTQRANPERDVQTISHQVLILITQLQVNLYPGIAPEKRRQTRSNLQAPETHGRTDSQWTGDGLPARLEAVFGGVHGSEDVPALVVVALAFIGQR